MGGNATSGTGFVIGRSLGRGLMEVGVAGWRAARRGRSRWCVGRSRWLRIGAMHAGSVIAEFRFLNGQYA
jgi:hypothetical protein